MKDAVERLLMIAAGDTGGSRCCAMFVLSLWDGGSYRADLQALLYVDPQVFADFMFVLNHLYGNNRQLEDFVTEQQIQPIIAAWGAALSVANS